MDGAAAAGDTANFDHGIDAFSSILKRPCKLEDAIAAVDKLLVRAAEDSMRMVCVGIGLSRRNTGYFATARKTANRTPDRILGYKLAACVPGDRVDAASHEITCFQVLWRLEALRLGVPCLWARSCLPAISRLPVRVSSTGPAGRAG